MHVALSSAGLMKVPSYRAPHVCWGSDHRLRLETHIYSLAVFEAKSLTRVLLAEIYVWAGLASSGGSSRESVSCLLQLLEVPHSFACGPFSIVQQCL